MAPSTRTSSARDRLLEVATDVIRRQGLHATTVDDLCEAAGVTKGAFFHHFPTKEALAIEAARHWGATTGAMFASSPYHDADDAVGRVRGYLDLRESLVTGAPEDFSCLAGTMVSEAFATQPDVRDACADAIFGHVATLVDDFAAALARSTPRVDVDPESLARFTQTVLQGAFVMAKASDDPTIVTDSIDHVLRYLSLLLDEPDLAPDTDQGASP